MTISISLTQASTLDELARAVYHALVVADCPDLASEAACLRSHARDAQEYIAAVLQLSDELRVEWKEARG